MKSGNFRLLTEYIVSAVQVTSQYLIALQNYQKFYQEE